MRRLPQNQRGAAIVAVIFILVALGAIGLALSKITQNSQQQVADSFFLPKSFYTAQSGIEWALQRISSGALISDIQGTQSLPDGEQFVITYDSLNDILTSTANVGNTERKVRFSNFSLQFASARCSSDSAMPAFPNETGYGESFTDLASITLTGGATETLAPGNYLLSTLDISGNSTLTINGPATVYVDQINISDEFTVTGNSQLVINGDVKFYVKGDVGITGSSSVTLGTGSTIGIDATGDVTISGASGFTCV